LQLTHLFKGEESFAIKGWMSEGMAVFAEQYALETYLPLEFSKEEINGLDTRFHKFTRSEVEEMYSRRFDENFDIDTEEQSISQTYKHSGFIFANLYFKDKTIIKKLFSELINTTPSACSQCSLIATRKTFEKITKMRMNQILYPLKENILIPDRKTDVLFRKE
jgi:hypothetical protein